MYWAVRFRGPVDYAVKGDSVIGVTIQVKANEFYIPRTLPFLDREI